MAREYHWMTTPEAAEFLGVSRSTVRRWLQTKRLHGRRIGKRWLIPHPEHIEITPSEAATLLRAHPDTVRRWLSEGRLSGRRVGRRWLIPRSELITMVEGAADSAGG